MPRYAIGFYEKNKKQQVRKVLLLGLFIMVDTGQAFVTDWAERRTNASEKPGRRCVPVDGENVATVL